MAEYQSRDTLDEQGLLTTLQKEHDVHGFDDMPASILASFVGMWGLLLLVLWTFFAVDKPSAFAVAISTGFVAIFFAVPRLMIRQTKPKLRREGEFKTYTGPLSDRAAATQVLLIPTALTFTLFAMGIIKALVAYN
jgi:hypothetical protein